MRDILEYCIGGIRQNVSAGTLVIYEGGRTGHLYVLIEGRLEGSTAANDTMTITYTSCVNGNGRESGRQKVRADRAGRIAGTLAVKGACVLKVS